MVFKITSSGSDPFSLIECKEFLIVSLEDQVCLDSIPGWEPVFLEENGHETSIGPPSLSAQETPVANVASKSSEAVGEKCAISKGGREERTISSRNLPQGGRVEAVKRKIFANYVAEKAPQQNAKHLSDDTSHEGHHTALARQPLSHKTVCGVEEISLSKRPRSLPDFRNSHITEEHSVDATVPSNGKEAVAKEDLRLNSLVLASRVSLQKDSPVSRSLNSISDFQNDATLFRSRLHAEENTLTNLRNRSLFSPSPDAVDSNGKQSTPYKKKSCVRRLDLDNNISLQNIGSKPRSGHQPGILKEGASSGYKGQFSAENPSASVSTKRQQLGTSSKSDNSPVRHVSNLCTPPADIVSRSVVASGLTQNIPGSQNNLPISEQYRLGPDTQRVLISDFGEDSMSVSEKLYDPGHPRVSTQIEVEIPKDTQKDGYPQISNDPEVSEELVAGGQHWECGSRVERVRNTQQDRSEVSQRTESEQGFEGIGNVLGVLYKGLPAQPQSVRFTASQIKSMCDVVYRLYNS